MSNTAYASDLLANSYIPLNSRLWARKNHGPIINLGLRPRILVLLET